MCLYFTSFYLMHGTEGLYHDLTGAIIDSFFTICSTEASKKNFNFMIFRYIGDEMFNAVLFL